MRDTLWVEDVMWALRVRKTRRDFDKWEVNEHRDEVRYPEDIFRTPWLLGFRIVCHALNPPPNRPRSDQMVLQLVAASHPCRVSGDTLGPRRKIRCKKTVGGERVPI